MPGRAESAPASATLTLEALGGPFALTVSPLGLLVSSPPSLWRRLRGSHEGHTTTHPFRHVLAATVAAHVDSLSGPRVDVAFLSDASGKLRLERIAGTCWGAELDEPQRWVDDLMTRSYVDGVLPRRRLLVLVNCFGGSGKADSIWKATVKPILAAAGCSIEVKYTGPAGSAANAFELAAALDLARYDALVPVAGDGVVHELLNGLASRPDALEALRLPIAPIAGGSGNALCVNLMGPVHAFDYSLAALSVVKGRAMALDLCSITRGPHPSRRTYGFLSCGLGLVAELDVGTEHLRMLGNLRFVLGYIYGSIFRSRYPIELSVHLVEARKEVMVASYNASSPTTPRFLAPSLASRTLSVDAARGMPPLSFGTVADDLPGGADVPLHDALCSPAEPGWHTFRTDVQYLYTGLLPWMARDTQNFPLAGQRDGNIDLVVVPPLGRWESLAAIQGSEEGVFFASPRCFYLKATAFRVTPLAATGSVTVDGESMPHTPFQVECHAGLARVLSLEGRIMGRASMAL